jgi:hypothetical protein
MNRLNPLVAVAALSLLVACAPGTGEGEGEGEGPAQCDTVSYVAFDVVNYENQVARVGAHAQMVALMKEAEADPTLAATKFAEAEALYTDTADLAEKVEGRKDDHLDTQPAVGADLHAAITAALADGKAATTTLEATLARQTIDKSLTDFFFLSVFHEMVLGAADKWDEAFGYYGASIDNAEGDAKGLAAVAAKRDGDNGTSLRERIFNGLVDGSCELARQLDAQDADTIDVNAADSAALRTVIDDVDVAMQEVLAYSVGHEAIDMQQLQDDLASSPGDRALLDGMRVKLYELDPYFRPLERLMNARGGDSATRASDIRSAIDAALADDTDAWVDTFDAAAIETAIEAEYGIDVAA